MKTALYLAGLLILASPAWAVDGTVAVTAGAGTNMGVVTVTGTNYPTAVITDPTTPTQHMAVDGSGNASVKVNSALPPGPSIIGKVGIDQTTPGTTNLVAASQSGAWTAATTAADGTNVTLGAKADAATCATANTLIACIRQLDADVKAAVPPGTNNIGAVNTATGSTAVAGQIIQADKSAAIAISTATTTQLVAIDGTKKIYVTAWDVLAAGTGGFKLVYGTGAACAVGQAALTGSYSLTAQVGLSRGAGLGPLYVVPAGNALCAVTTQAVAMDGSVSYAQF